VRKASLMAQVESPASRTNSREYFLVSVVVSVQWVFPVLLVPIKACHFQIQDSCAEKILKSYRTRQSRMDTSLNG
jgi:hypothetical protein